VRIDVFTIFPDLVRGYCEGALLGKALAASVLELRIHDLRAAATDRHRSVDDAPFGGGAGMVMAPGPIFSAVEAANPPRPLYLLGPAGRTLDQALVRELATTEGFSLLCGRYEGVDQRVADHLVDGEVSIGDYVLAGGELAALVVVEAVARLVPGVMGNEHSAADESFAEHLVEYPHYTRPATFRGWQVPEVLRSGDHSRVARWRRAQSLVRTQVLRPDLIASRGGLNREEVRLCAEHGYPGPHPGPTEGPTEEHPER
jgi:tRNA (guanine37-N1)-methyltransferase